MLWCHALVWLGLPRAPHKCPMQVAHGLLRASTFRKWRSPQRLGLSLPASQPQCPALNLGGSPENCPSIDIWSQHLGKSAKVTKRKPRPSMKPVYNFCPWVTLPADFCYKIKINERNAIPCPCSEKNYIVILSLFYPGCKMEMKFTSLPLCGLWLIYHA